MGHDWPENHADCCVIAICFEMLGQFDDALSAYRPADAPLGGDALLALGRLQPFVDKPQVQEPCS